MGSTVEDLILRIRVQNSQATAAVTEINDIMDDIDNKIGRNNTWQKNMLGFGLAMLFTGMAVKRLGETILTSLVKTYMMATDNQNRFHQQLMAVQASFEFLKFSIMDALGNNEFVVSFIEMLIEMVNRVSEFVNKHPQIALIIGLFSVMAVVIGGVAMVLGQLSLLALGLQMKLLPVMGYLFGIALIGTLLVSIFTTDMQKANPVLTSLKVTLAMIAIAVMSIFSPILGVIFLLLMIGTVVAKLKSDFGSFGNFFKAIVRGLIMIVGLFGQALIEVVLAPLQQIARGLVSLAKLAKISVPSILTDFSQYKPDFVGKAATLASSIEFDKSEGKLFQGNEVNITLNGDVTEQGMMERIQEGIKQFMDETSTRYSGTTRGA